MPLLLVFEMHPLRDMNTAHEFEYFLGLEHFFILTKMVLMSFYTQAPFDVRIDVDLTPGGEGVGDWLPKFWEGLFSCISKPIFSTSGSILQHFGGSTRFEHFCTAQKLKCYLYSFQFFTSLYHLAKFDVRFCKCFLRKIFCNTLTRLPNNASTLMHFDRIFANILGIFGKLKFHEISQFGQQQPRST